MSVRAFRVADSYGASTASGHHQRFVVDLDSEIPASANPGDTCYSLQSSIWRTWQNAQWNGTTAGPPDPHTHTLADITDAGTAAAADASDFSAAAHNHDGTYAAAAHNHDASYSALGHNHDASYAAVSHAHAAAAITSGTIATARLGSGSASSSTFLRGDQTWAAPPSGGGGGATIKAGVVSLAAGGSATVSFPTPFSVTPVVCVTSQFNSADTSTTLSCHTISVDGFTLRGAGNSAGNVGWIAVEPSNP